MKINLKSLTLTIALTATAAGAYSQVFYAQPYTVPQASFESRVQNCGSPFPVNRVAMDDFVIPAGAQFVLNRIYWWGTLSSAAQAQRPYLVALYRDNNCLPWLNFGMATAGAFYLACVVPDQVGAAGVDCQGKTVYRFSAPVPPVVLGGGLHAWIQISEVDSLSIRPGKVDFKWSGRRPIQFCPARRWILPATLGKLKDPCDLMFDDLSFALSM